MKFINFKIKKKIFKNFSIKINITIIIIEFNTFYYLSSLI